MAVIMESTYRIPKKSCSSSERWAFWDKVIADQSTSGINRLKFCRQHQLKYATFMSYIYRKPVTSNINQDDKLKNKWNHKSIANFIPLQVATDASVKGGAENANTTKIICDGAEELKIVFSNGHKLILPLSLSKVSLLSIIKTVAEL